MFLFNNNNSSSNNPFFVPSSSPQQILHNNKGSINKINSGSSSIPSGCPQGGCCCCGVVHVSETEFTSTEEETIDHEDSGFFPRESSDSGLLEEIVHRFMTKSKSTVPKNCDIMKTGTLQESLLPQPDHMFVSAPMNIEGFGTTTVPFDNHHHQGLPLPMESTNLNNGLINFNSNTNQAMSSVGIDQFIMDQSEWSIMQDIFQYPELLNSFAARMQSYA